MAIFASESVSIDKKHEENSHLLKHLEFIQLTIVRMAANSFIVKGWSVTFVAAILAFTNKDANSGAALIALLPAFLFWRLDGYFLSQERLYRALYDDVRQNPGRSIEEVDFSLNAVAMEKPAKSWFDRLWLDDRWFRCCWSKTVWGFYIILVVAVLAVWYIGPQRSGASEDNKWQQKRSTASTTTTTTGGQVKSGTSGPSKGTPQSPTTIGKPSPKAGTTK